MEIITSLQNQRVKLAQQLQKKARVRRRERKFVLEGVRLIDDALMQKHIPQVIFYDPERIDYDFLAKLQNHKPAISLLAVSSDVMSAISDTQQPSGITGIFMLPMPSVPKIVERILILDAIREPGNMGTIIRTARAAGVELIILAPECVDPYNPKVVRSAMGAHFALPIIEATWDDIQQYVQGMGVYVAMGEADAIYSDIDWTHRWAVVVGNEANGVGENIQRIEHTPIRIPMANDTESLNAGIATAVILFEAQRQRFVSK